MGSTRSRLEERFLRDIGALGIPAPKLEYRFALDIVGREPGVRKRLQEAGLKDWRLDFAWPQYRLAFEIEGLHSTDRARGYGGGRHLTPEGFTEDCLKYSEAQLLGWTVYRVPGTWVSSRKMLAINLLLRALAYHARWTR